MCSSLTQSHLPHMWLTTSVPLRGRLGCSCTMRWWRYSFFAPVFACHRRFLSSVQRVCAVSVYLPSSEALPTIWQHSVQGIVFDRASSVDGATSAARPPTHCATKSAYQRSSSALHLLESIQPPPSLICCCLRYLPLRAMVRQQSAARRVQSVLIIRVSWARRFFDVTLRDNMYMKCRLWEAVVTISGRFSRSVLL